MSASPSPLPLIGRRAVVTGSSSGVGREIALHLAMQGADVLVHARRSAEAAEEVAEQIRRTGRQAAVQLEDLATLEGCERFADAAWNWQQGLDIWVNNAGADVLTGAAASWSFHEKLEYLWQVDVRATMQLSRTIGERMRGAAGEKGAAVILNMGWDQAEIGMEGDSGEMFAAIKGAVICFSRSLAKSLAPHVRVNCLAPGWIRTAWGTQADSYWQQRAIRESLLERWGTPEDVAHAAGYLVSPQSNFITGQTIAINGGFRHGNS